MPTRFASSNVATKDNASRYLSSVLFSGLTLTLASESIIDSVLHPEIRDRMIMYRGRYDLLDCIHEFRLSVKVHGDEILNHANWEISEKWLRNFNLLVDTQTIEVVNRWRRERGEPELRVADFAKPTEHPSRTPA